MGTVLNSDFHPDKKSVTLKLTSTAEGMGVSTNKFVFDRVFDTSTSQKEVYDVSAKPIIESVLEGFNGTVFAYG